MQARGYHDVAGSGCLSVPELIPAAANLMEYLAVTGEDEALVLTESTVPEPVVAALAAAARMAGARTSVLAVEPFSPGGFQRGTPSPVVVGAWEQATVVVSCVWWAEVHTEPLFFSKLPQLGARLAAMHQTATPGAMVTGGRLPPAVFYEIKRRVLDRVGDAREVRVRTAHGTDVTMRDLRVDTDNGPIAEPGQWSPFPYGGVNWYPGDTEGVAVLEETTVTGVPSAPLRLRIEGNQVVGIDGGREVRELERFSPSGYYVRHAFIGLNPKVRIKNAPQFEREKHAGAFYWGLDSLAAADRGAPGFAHLDCQFDFPTITVDGEVLVDDGYLVTLDHPAVRATAARFGDPDRLLLPNPYLW
jgi:hypothetical protein